MLIILASTYRKDSANILDEVVSLCHEGILSSAQPDAHNTIDPSSSTWAWLTTAHGELSLASIPTLQQNFTAPMRAAIVPRTYKAAISCGQLMSLTEMQAAHDKINHTLFRWSTIIESCNRWVDGERYETCSVLTDIAKHVGFGYSGPLKSVLIIDFHIRKFLEFSQRSTERHLEILLKESTDLSLIVKKVIWGYPLTRHQMIILMFYDLDFLMKTVDEVLKQNKFNSIYQPGFFVCRSSTSCSYCD